MKLACSSMLLPVDNFREKLTLLESFGYEGIEIRLLESEATPQKIAEIKESLEESPIEASSIIMPGPAYQLAFESEEARVAKLALAEGGRGWSQVRMWGPDHS